MRSKDLGFNQDQVLVIRDGGLVSGEADKMELLRNELASTGGVENISAASSYPGQQSWSVGYRLSENTDEKRMSLSTIFADHDYLDTYELEIVAGRNFDRSHTTDTSAFLINEAAAKLFGTHQEGWEEDPIGKTIKWIYINRTGPIVGVFKDFHFESLRNEINPLIIQIYPPYFFTVQIRLQTDNIAEKVAHIESSWKNFFPPLHLITSSSMKPLAFTLKQIRSWANSFLYLRY